MRREAFYWLAILFTFALGTAAGDLAAEYFNLGYLVSLGLFAGLIALVTAAYYGTRFYLGENYKYAPSVGVLAFWLAYVLTRPLGASIGDYLSQAPGDGGLSLGATWTSRIFLLVIL